jgi:hypothetical protein
MECFFAPQTTLFIWKMCTLDGAAVGWENPRLHYESPVYRMTLENRQRQLHDEEKSCGTQPAYIRVIYRLLSMLLCPKFTFLKEKVYETIKYSLDRFNTYQCKLLSIINYGKVELYLANDKFR